VSTKIKAQRKINDTQIFVDEVETQSREKPLLCNVAAFIGILLYPESTLQLCSSRRFCEVVKDLFRFPVSRPDDVVFRPDAHQSATFVRTTRSFRPEAHQCLEASTSSRLHPSRHNGKSSGRSSEFEKIPVF
jgi:hypothetical protein